jgi:cytochrome c biogenesis protein CcdA
MAWTMTDHTAEALAAESLWLVPLAFLAGLCTSLNPCAYPLMGAVAGYVWSRGEWSATVFLRSRWGSQPAV